ncbi:WecB/TagA/CpsF family glycosyltransferase [Ideonella sp.]|uniref:WecB/TagA/CpsF family glycosyltransferase n=1 Tax=Ideonella sp. TaxID=1929293 RepID=UPI003BB4A410
MTELFGQLDRSGGIVFTTNPDHLYHLQRSPAFMAAYRAADFVTVDSHYVRWAMRLAGRPVQHRITGSDLLPAYCQHLAKQDGAKVFLLGAKPGVAQRALERINARVGCEVVVGAHGPSMSFVNDAVEVAQVLSMIRQSGAKVLFVGLGAPKQELFIAQIRNLLPAEMVMVGVGATIDYEAGEVTRAPVWMRRMGLEWLHRVGTDPRRYLARYVRSSEFFWWMLLDKLGRYQDPLAPASSAPAPPSR